MIPVVNNAHGTIPQKLDKGAKRVVNQRTSRNYRNNCVTNISPNTKMSLGNLRRLDCPQTPGKDHHLTLVWSIHNIYNNMNIKIFVKNEKELEALIQTIKIYCKDIEIKFVIQKFSMMIMKKKKEQNHSIRRARKFFEKRKTMDIWEYEMRILSNKLKLKTKQERIPKTCRNLREFITFLI